MIISIKFIGGLQEPLTKRKSPIKHRVRSHKRSERNVHSYTRGHRTPLSHIAHQIKLAHKPLHSKIQRQLNKKHLRNQEGFKIYLVDGDIVRKYFWEDFWRGAHGEGLFHFIPRGEIWIERGLSLNIRENVIRHELIEAHLMKGNGTKGLPYELAHTSYAEPAETKKLTSITYLDKHGRKKIEVTDNPVEFYRRMRMGELEANIISVHRV